MGFWGFGVRVWGCGVWGVGVLGFGDLGFGVLGFRGLGGCDMNSEMLIWEFPKIRGIVFWGPHNKDPPI